MQTRLSFPYPWEADANGRIHVSGLNKARLCWDVFSVYVISISYTSSVYLSALYVKCLYVDVVVTATVCLSAV